VTSLALLALLACGREHRDCEQGDSVAATREGVDLACAEVAPIETYIVLLAGRPVAPVERGLLYDALRERWREDPSRVHATIGAAAAAIAALEPTGAEAATRRSNQAWLEEDGRGVFAADEELRTLVGRSMSVWARDPEEQLVLTETDIEGWIHYASLCREAQDGSPLTASVSDRVRMYAIVKERFDTGSRAEQVSMVAVGAFWWSVRDRWRSATYEEQRAWIAAAPLPPPMTATSLGYFEAVLSGDLPGHARALHQELGPLTLQPAAP
jgi:hypothetical protein